MQKAITIKGNDGTIYKIFKKDKLGTLKVRCMTIYKNGIKREWGCFPGCFREVPGEFPGEDSHFFSRVAGSSIGRPRSVLFPGRFPGNVVPGVMFFMKVRAVWPERTPAVCPGRVLQAEKSDPQGEKHGRRPQMVWLYLFL